MIIVSGIVVIGIQWGDEGKGKAIDVFSSEADYVVRYQGGSNAGHSLNMDGKTCVLHLIPSGIFRSHTTCVIASGVVVDLRVLEQEIKLLEKFKKSLSLGRLFISDGASVLLDYHQKLDRAREKSPRLIRIGTTGKGVGPAYEDRISRFALLFRDLFQKKEVLQEKLKIALFEKNFLIQKLYKQKPLRVSLLVKSILSQRKILKKYRHVNTSDLIHRALVQKKRVLFEGAQGTLLDLVHGTYPYVTGCSTLSSFACAGSGVGFNRIQKIIGVTKSYTTRVGEGPFPTQCQDPSLRDYLQKKGAEWGATTGRMRRCGWLDLVALKYSIQLNGVTHLALMKLDVLSGLDSVPICTSYLLKGQKISYFPLDEEECTQCQPVYQNLPGWKEDISRVKKIKDLPPNAYKYLNFIQKELNIPIEMVSVGRDRKQTIQLQPVFVDV